MDNKRAQGTKSPIPFCVSLLLVSRLKAKHYFIKEEEHKKQQTAFSHIHCFWQGIRMSRERWGHERKSGRTDKSKKSKA